MPGTPSPGYEPSPVYPPGTGQVLVGWDEIAAGLPAGCRLLAVDGPAAMDWPALIDAIEAALVRAGRPMDRYDVRRHLLDWPTIVRRTESAALADDPDFAALATGTLAALFGDIPVPEVRAGRLLVVFGPGAALIPAEAVWYADLPKRYAEAAVGAGQAHNVGQPATQPATLRRLFYVDWPLLDRHRDAIAGRLDMWIDVQHPRQPAGLGGASLRETLAGLSGQPFRTRPTFNTTSWGGHWGQTALGMNPGARNTALGYELIAPESGILIGTHGGAAVEVPFQLLVSAHPRRMLGTEISAAFGRSFPIRFDYLDTVGGGNLSVHCHPLPEYMRSVFGWPYTQHETYYIMVGGDGQRVFLGLREDADVAAFQEHAHRADANGVPLDIERYVQTYPATPHQLFLVPAGTPHGSGEGNVVLEISATPYLYSLRFYDWLRNDADGQPRPIHVDHAFRNLDHGRRAAAVAADLVPQPRPFAEGDGWRELVLGSLPEMFFDVRRLEIGEGAAAPADTRGRFHVLNVVEGTRVEIATESGQSHPLRYAETLVIPASVGRYRVASSGGAVRVVKALVR